MNRRMILPSILLATAMLPCTARDVTIHFKEATTGSVTVKMTEDVRLNFADANLSVTPPDGTAPLSFPLGAIEKVTFGSAAGIGEVGTDSQSTRQLLYNSSSATLSGNGWEQGEASPLSIHAIDGRCLLSLPRYGGENLDLSTLTPGIYIARAGATVLKFNK